MSNYDFYGVNIDTPMSYAHNTPQFPGSAIGQLAAETDGKVHIKEIPYQHLGATHGWRVCDAYWSEEDGIMTYFRAFDLEGNMLPEATFGVNYGESNSQIRGGFKYRPAFNNQYYIPVENQFATPSAGGYSVEVLDMLNPSEGMAFGLSMAGRQHRALVISFRLFALGEGYPNELDLPVR